MPSKKLSPAAGAALKASKSVKASFIHDRPAAAAAARAAAAALLAGLTRFGRWAWPGSPSLVGGRGVFHLSVDSLERAAASLPPSLLSTFLGNAAAIRMQPSRFSFIHISNQHPDVQPVILSN